MKARIARQIAAIRVMIEQESPDWIVAFIPPSMPDYDAVKLEGVHLYFRRDDVIEPKLMTVREAIADGWLPSDFKVEIS